jgi:hypothetical protein
MDSFEQGLSMTVDAAETADGSFRASWPVPDAWQQGRGAWGGLVVGASIRALALVNPEPGRAVRTISSHMFGPVPNGDCSIEVAPVRRGAAMSTWAVSIWDPSGARCTESIVITGGSRGEDIAFPEWGTVTMPKAPGWEHVPAVPVGPPMGPVFGPHLEFRPIAGLPFSGSEARALGWSRFTEHSAPQEERGWTAEELLAIVDGWWPAGYVRLPAPRTMATVSFSAHLLADPASVPIGEPVLMESAVTSAFEGFTSELRRLWSVDGRVLVENLQSIVVVN